MESFIDVSGRVSQKFKEIAKNVALQCLKFTNQPKGLEVAICFVSEEQIKTLNREQRKIDKVTDVLSFPASNMKTGEIFDLSSPECEYLKNQDGLVHFGDMAICTKRLREQAKEFGNSAEDELKKLVIHSMLHLMGYDHILDSDFEIMNKKEQELSKIIDINKLK